MDLELDTFGPWFGVLISGTVRTDTAIVGLQKCKTEVDSAIMIAVKYMSGLYTRVFSRDILKGGNFGVLAGGRGVLGVYYLLENIIHYYFITANLKGGEIPPFSPPPPPPPLENILRSSFHQNFEETKGYSPGCFFQGPKKCVEKSNPSECKRKEKLNGACFSCISHVSREL